MSVLTASSITAPLVGLAGSRHQLLKSSSASTFAPSHFTPVPVAAVLQGGITGIAYSETITAQGGTSPYTFAVTSGSLPTGLSMTSGGVISGTPSVAATSTFTVTVTDANGFTGSQSFQIAIAAPSGGGGGSYVFLA